MRFFYIHLILNSKKILSGITLILINLSMLFGQDTTLVPKLKIRKTIVYTSAAIGSVTGAIGFNNLWYNDPKVPFHFFNDNKQWKQVDKFGHSYTAYLYSDVIFQSMRWIQKDSVKSIWIATGLGFVAQLPIEYFDGRSVDYGASWGDLAANFVGSTIFVSQNLLKNKISIQPKFSAHLTNKALFRPQILGSNLSERIIKDYNGQSYWLSFSLPPSSISKIPKWLTLDLGYGAEQMIYGSDAENKLVGFRAYRQFYLSTGINWSYIPTKNRALKSVFHLLNYVKFPAPTMEISKNSRLHWLYF